MACFPFFIELSEKSCLVLGGGRVAYRKVKALLEFAARVHLVSPDICGEIRRLQNEYGGNRLFLSEREYEDGDFADVFLAVAATDNEKYNRQAAQLCRERHILVNVVDCKELCDFYFPAIVKRKELVIGVSSSGKSPLLAGRVRGRLEKAVPEYYGEINQQLGELRERVQGEIPGERERKRCLEELLERLEREGRRLSIEEMEEVIGSYQ